MNKIVTEDFIVNKHKIKYELKIKKERKVMCNADTIKIFSTLLGNFNCIKLFERLKEENS